MDVHPIPVAAKVLAHHFRVGMSVDEQIVDTVLAAQTHPDLEDRNTLDLEQALGKRIGEWTKASSMAGRK